MQTFLRSLNRLLTAVLEEFRQLRSAYFFRRPLMIALALYASAILLMNYGGWLDKPSSFDPSQYSHQAGRVTGVVAQHPDPRPTGCVYEVEAESIELFLSSRTAVSLNGRFLLHVIGSTHAVAQPGDRVQASGQFRLPPPARIPGTFDYRRYLSNHGIHSILYTSSTSLRVLGHRVPSNGAGTVGA